jgi:hypothetical protein
MIRPASRTAAHPRPDQFVLPEHMTSQITGRGPRFGDDVWDFTAFVPRTTSAARLAFTRITDPVARSSAREYFHSRLTRTTPKRPHAGSRPIKLTWARHEFERYVIVLDALGDLGVTRLADATKQHLDAVVRRWLTEPYQGRRPAGRHPEQADARTIATWISTIKHMAAHRDFITGDKLGFDPWPGRPALHIARHPGRDEENSTPRIAEPIMAAMLKAALFYVTTASVDILAARDEVARMDAGNAVRPRRRRGEAPQILREFIHQRSEDGRGIPARAKSVRVSDQDVPIIGGVIQAPNYTLIFQMAGVVDTRHLRAIVRAAGTELGYEQGGLDTAMSAWPDTGAPWRPRLSRGTLGDEITRLRTACWIVIGYLSGMRDGEVRELRRDCAFVTTDHDGRTRFKLRGRVFKGRELSGDEADWVVLEAVHQAVDVLLKINEDPTHLFGYRSYLGHPTLMDEVPSALNAFRDHINELFSTPEGPFVPLDDQKPWSFNTRQFRRTLAWHLAHQPFGVVAGARQYKHAKIAMFEGYAGTSASGFAAEVAAEEAVAMLDYLEELYQDWNDGRHSSGGAADRINGEFDRIRRELGDLPGVVAEPARLRTMLAHLTKTLHPGVLNDCFFQPAAALCVKRAKVIGRPVPQHNMCMRCPNARRSTIHLPRLVQARDQALDLRAECERREPMPKLQQIAITGYIDELDQLISGLDPATEDGT